MVDLPLHPDYTGETRRIAYEEKCLRRRTHFAVRLVKLNEIHRLEMTIAALDSYPAMVALRTLRDEMRRRYNEFCETWRD